MSKLQVKTLDGWKYVFCYNTEKGKAITTDIRSKALAYSDKQYIEKHNGNLELRSL